MDEAVLAALARWPNVPAVYGWLGLDRRGQWRLQGEAIRHAGLAAFISRNYALSEAGEAYFQNGPQRVYVALEYTPWVLRWTPADGLVRHTGEPVAAPGEAWLDEQGNLLIAFEDGVGLVCDQDLQALLPLFSRQAGAPSPQADQELAEFLANPGAHPLWLNLGSRALPVGLLAAREVPGRFRFNPDPAPPAGKADRT